MAFHTPNPEIRALEERNARLRAALFSKVYRGAWRGLRKGIARLARLRSRRRDPRA